MVTNNALNITATGIVKYDGVGTFTATTTTNHNVLIGSTSNAITNVAPSATSGIALISQGAAVDPAFGTVVVAGGGTGAITLTGILTGNGTSPFTASTVTQFGVLVGGASNAVASTAVGSAGQVLQSSGAGVNPAYSTATYPSTTTINQILYSSSNNVVAGLATANRAVLTTGATGIPVLTALATDGQLIIGSTAGVPAAASLTAGTGITITPGSNSITIAANGAVVGQTITGDSGGALSPTAGNWNILGLAGSKTSGSGSTLTVKSPPFSQVGGSGTSALNTGEFVTTTATRTLPVSAGLADGDLFMYVCTTANLLTIQSVGSQKIRIGNQISSTAGTIVSTAIGDSITLRFNATDGFFYGVAGWGNWTFT